MGYMTTEGIIEKLETLQGEELVDFITNCIPTVKNGDKCQDVFDLVYSKMNDPWGYSEQKYRYDTILNTFRPILEGKRIVDCGSGIGFMWAHPPYSLAHVTLLEVSELAVAKSKVIFNESSVPVQWLQQGMHESGAIPEDVEVLFQCNALYYVPGGSRPNFYRMVSERRPEYIITAANGTWRDIILQWPEYLSTRYAKFASADFLAGYKYEFVEGHCIPEEEGRVPNPEADVNYNLFRLVKL